VRGVTDPYCPGTLRNESSKKVGGVRKNGRRLKVIRRELGAKREKGGKKGNAPQSSRVFGGQRTGGGR